MLTETQEDEAVADLPERLPDPDGVALSPECAEIDDARMTGDLDKLAILAERHLRELRDARSEADVLRARIADLEATPRLSRTLDTTCSVARQLGEYVTGVRALPLDPHDAAEALARLFEALRDGRATVAQPAGEHDEQGRTE